MKTQSLVRNRAGRTLWLSALAILLVGCGSGQRSEEPANRVAQAALPSDPVLHSSIDVPAPDTRIGKRLVVAGWAFASGGAVQEIAVLVDGSKAAVAAYGGARPDVAKQFGDSALHSGWYTEIDGSKIPAGKHTISV